jgi:hypothetical protein
VLQKQQQKNQEKNFESVGGVRTICCHKSHNNAGFSSFIFSQLSVPITSPGQKITTTINKRIFLDEITSVLTYPDNGGSNRWQISSGVPLDGGW